MRFYKLIRVMMPFMMLKVSFDLFGRAILDDFNIILIPGTEGMVAEMESVFGIGVELIGSIKDVMVEWGAVNFFPMFI